MVIKGSRMKNSTPYRIVLFKLRTKKSAQVFFFTTGGKDKQSQEAEDGKNSGFHCFDFLLFHPNMILAQKGKQGRNRKTGKCKTKSLEDLR